MMSETSNKTPKPAPTPLETKTYIFDVPVVSIKVKSEEELMIEAMKAHLFKEDGEAYHTFRCNVLYQEKEKVPSRAEELKD
jgi:hypothetical protein